MDEAKIKAMELAKDFKPPKDLNQLSAMFKKLMIETAFNTELTEHLDYEKHQPQKTDNHRNGTSPKVVLTPKGLLNPEIPRDREGLFELQIVEK